MFLKFSFAFLLKILSDISKNSWTYCTFAKDDWHNIFWSFLMNPISTVKSLLIFSLKLTNDIWCMDVLLMNMTPWGGMTPWCRYNDFVMTSVWSNIDICCYFTIGLAICAEKHRFSHFSGKFFHKWFENFSFQKTELDWILEFVLFDCTIFFSFQRKKNTKKYNQMVSRLLYIYQHVIKNDLLKNFEIN